MMALPITHPDYKLTPKMMKALELAMQPGVEQNIQKLCEMIPVSRSAFQKWLKPGHPFRLAWDKLPYEMMGRRLPFIVAALARKAENGDVRAAELCMKYMGLLTERHEFTHEFVDETTLAQKLNAIVLDVSCEPVKAIAQGPTADGAE